MANGHVLSGIKPFPFLVQAITWSKSMLYSMDISNKLNEIQSAMEKRYHKLSVKCFYVKIWDEDSILTVIGFMIGLFCYCTCFFFVHFVLFIQNVSGHKSMLIARLQFKGGSCSYTVNVIRKSEGLLWFFIFF